MPIGVLGVALFLALPEAGETQTVGHQVLPNAAATSQSHSDAEESSKQRGRSKRSGRH